MFKSPLAQDQSYHFVIYVKNKVFIITSKVLRVYNLSRNIKKPLWLFKLDATPSKAMSFRKGIIFKLKFVNKNKNDKRNPQLEH